MLTASFLRHIEIFLGKNLRSKLHIRRVSPVSGGSINLTAKIDTTSGVYFLKVNDAFKFPGMFDKEAAGLEMLRSTNTFAIPKVILKGEEDGQAFLILEFIEQRNQAPDFWRRFGKSLAELHRNTADHFGYPENNYIGSLPQSNQKKNKWVDFFIEERLNPQMSKAFSYGLLNTNDVSKFQKLFSGLDKMIPVEVPSLLHGDLWNGNFMSDVNGNPCLIDPAIYFGHREMDLAMTKLFGGFSEEFYEVYQAEFPMAPGFEDRVMIHNLYPLLVHVNLFGGNYVNEVRSILKEIV